MVQGELNTALSPTIANQTQANNVGARLYENINPKNMDGGGGVSAIANDPTSASNGGAEKKKKVGNYIISKTIGEGSFAKVRLGYHLITQQMVAVKVINKREVLKRNYLRANLRREASMMQRMQHPHIIQLYEVMETENCYYIVMELIDGIEFVKYLTKKRSLDENETRQYIRQICSAVDHMHKAKVVHRDIKLQNFMLDQNHNLTIIDFGLSNCLDERDFLNTQCGSPAYAAPEIFAHQDYGSEVDIWSIGVNMYAMLAGKLPFKVENRSKNLAKLHACILKGFEMPSYLSPDCQDLLCRLLDPSPNKRLKMSEIFAHPWLNYNSFPVEIIPYKPVVDLKEVKPQIVQYLVQKHDYTENEVIDAIVHRKPIAIKAVYYLIEKRLKQGLSFPDADYQNSVENENAVYTTNVSSVKQMAASASSHVHHPSQHHHGGSNGNILLDNANINNLGTSFQPAPVNGGLVKQNSQLLPKRHGIQLVTRSSSQKNVDFKSIFNNMNMNAVNSGSSAGGGNGATRISFNNLNREATNLNHHHHNGNNDSESPSPDFIAAAMSPIKTNQQQALTNNSNGHSNGHSNHVSSASSTRNAKSTNYQDIIQRKSNSNVTSTTTGNHHYQQSNQQQHVMTNGNVANKYMSNERYYVPMSTNGYHPNRMSPASEDSYAPVSSVHYHSPENIRTATTSSNYVSINPGVTNNNHRSVSGVITNGNGGLTGIRSLPSSIYRGSPERSLPRSPERMPIDHNNNYRPTTSRVSSSRPSANGSELSGAATYDALNGGQKYKSANHNSNNNYMGTKRSLTSCEDPNYDATKSKNSVNIIKNRQLQMGKAKIDLDTQQNFNVGVSIKNLGSYLKSSITRNSADALKTFNSLNIKPSSNYGKASAHANGSSNEQVNHVGSSKSRQSTTLTHRHSNPGSSYSSSSNHHATNGASNMKTRTTLQNPPNTISTDPSALPRIRINS